MFDFLDKICHDKHVIGINYKGELAHLMLPLVIPQCQEYKCCLLKELVIH